MSTLEQTQGGRGHLLVEAKLVDDIFYLAGVLLDLDSAIVVASMSAAGATREHCRLDHWLVELCRNARVGFVCSIVSALLQACRYLHLLVVSCVPALCSSGAD